jgi:hypothetical protein
MQKRLRGSNRAIVKKVTALNLYADQATQIQAIMEATGAKEVAPLVRDLLDEALAARRRKSLHRETNEQPPPTQDITETLQTIQTLLLKMIRQGEISLRAENISLVLLQEILAEASAGRKVVWKRLEVPALREKGIGSAEIAERFEKETNESKDYAYGIADEIRNSQELQANQPSRAHVTDELPFD